MIWFSAGGAGGDCSPAGRSAAKLGRATGSAGKQRLRDALTIAAGKPVQMRGCPYCDAREVRPWGRADGLPRAAHMRGGKPTKTGLSAERIPVLVARDRNGATLDSASSKLDRVSVTAVLSGVVTPANPLCLDGDKAIAASARVAGIAYHMLPKPGGPKPDAPELHINNVNACHSRLKGWLRSFQSSREQKPPALPRLAANP